MSNPLEGKKVLVIEDIAENMRLLRAVLRLEGANILEATRAPAGIELAQQHIPDIILMDLQMPEMDGLTATRILREDPRTRDIPIIAVTASVMERDRAQILAAGCDGYVPKPINPDTFAQEIVLFAQAKHASG